MRLVQFTKASSETDLYINPERVTYVFPQSNKATLIYFGENHVVAVNGLIDDVIAKLRTG